MRGIVRDPSGRAVPHAHVSVPEVRRDQTTGESGCFDVSGITAPGRRDSEVTISAPGYKSTTAKVRTLKDNILAVTLQPEGSTGESAVTPLREDPCEPRGR